MRDIWARNLELVGALEVGAHARDRGRAVHREAAFRPGGVNAPRELAQQLLGARFFY